jgi:hypothetical protein
MSEDYCADIYGTGPTFDEVFPETPKKMSRWTAFSPETLGYAILFFLGPDESLSLVVCSLSHQCDDGLCASPGAHRPTVEWSPVKPLRMTAEDLKFP